MQNSSKDLLFLERKDFSSSSLDSSLLVCKNNLVSKVPPCLNEKPTTYPASKSQVLGRVKDFLQVMSEANKKLELDAKDNSEKYDIEALDGSETKVIEMDLMLGVADLLTPEAVAAAESAIISNQPVIPLACSSDDDEDGDEEDKSDKPNPDHNTRSSINFKKSVSTKNRPSSKNKGKRKAKNLSKIQVLS